MHFHTIKTNHSKNEELDKMESGFCQIIDLTGSYGACSCMTWLGADHRKNSIQTNQPIVCI